MLVEVLIMKVMFSLIEGPVRIEIRNGQDLGCFGGFEFDIKNTFVWQY